MTNFHKTTTNDSETTICAVQNILYFNNKKDLISIKSVINVTKSAIVVNVRRHCSHLRSAAVSAHLDVPCTYRVYRQTVGTEAVNGQNTCMCI